MFTLSKAVLLHTFMVIEEPVTHLIDDDEFTPTGARLIGQFCAELLETIVTLAPTFSAACVDRST
jgi:hypothetical protein